MEKRATTISTAAKARTNSKAARRRSRARGAGTDLVRAAPAPGDNADGGEGDDAVVRGDGGEDTLNGGSGPRHRLLRERPAAASSTRRQVKGDGHDTLQGFEDVVRTAGDDIVGDGDVNRLDGGVGDDNSTAAAAPTASVAPARQLRGFAAEHSPRNRPRRPTTPS
jgi:hypothetical protein